MEDSGEFNLDVVTDGVMKVGDELRESREKLTKICELLMVPTYNDAITAIKNLIKEKEELEITVRQLIRLSKG